MADLLAHDMEQSGDLFRSARPISTPSRSAATSPPRPARSSSRTTFCSSSSTTPTTDKVHEVPLLIVPPWINKYLHPRSDAAEIFISYVVDAGLHSLRRIVGQPRRAPRPQDLRGLHVEGILGRTMPFKRETGVRADQRHRLLRRRHRTARPTLAYLAAARRRTRSSARRRSLPRKSTSPRPAICCCSPTIRSSRRWKR